MGMTSGGFMSQVTVDGWLDAGSQQQFLFKDVSASGGLRGGAWSMTTINVKVQLFQECTMSCPGVSVFQIVSTFSSDPFSSGPIPNLLLSPY